MLLFLIHPLQVYITRGLCATAAVAYFFKVVYPSVRGQKKAKPVLDEDIDEAIAAAQYVSEHQEDNK